MYEKINATSSTEGDTLTHENTNEEGKTFLYKNS
jgi:hypothetical protein